MVLCCHASLYRLKTDYIDLYQCHYGDLEDPTVFLEAFERLKQQGKIRAPAVSGAIPGAKSPEQLLANVRAASAGPLTKEELAAIDAVTGSSGQPEP